MRERAVHRWDVGYHEAVAIQEGLRERLILRDAGIAEPLRSVAGADISYDRGSDLFFAAVVVLSHRISLESAVVLTLACCRGYRLPEPVSQAHRAVNALRMAAPPGKSPADG